MGARRCRILFVDDCCDDHALFQNAIRRAGLTVDVLPFLNDGIAAISYLTGGGVYSDRNLYPLPDLLVLDLKMPLKTGHEVLAWLQTCPSAPVTVMFSGSERHEDIARANALGARHYFIRPSGWEEWTKTVAAILKHCPLTRNQPR